MLCKNLSLSKYSFNQKSTLLASSLLVTDLISIEILS
nr:MAG TPA: hypothetical protein [Caudoviricetes sp.]